MGKPPVQRQNVHIGFIEQTRDASDLRRTGQERQHIAVLLGKRSPHRPRHA